MGETRSIYNALYDQDTDNQHDYTVVYLPTYHACATCGRPTRDACVLCGKPFDGGCLFNIHLPEKREENPKMAYNLDFEAWERVEPDYEYARVCLACYTEHEKHPPFSWGWPTHRFVAYTAPRGAPLNQGSMLPAGDLDAWVSHSSAVSVLAFHYRDDGQGQTWPRELDAFATRSLLAWMLAWRQEIEIVANQASATLVASHNKILERARRADAGIIDYSLYE